MTTAALQADRKRSPLANLDVEAALEEIAAGTLSKEIAARYNVTPFAVRKRLALHPNYQDAVKAQAASLVEDATGLAMKCSNEDVAIARVRVDAAHKWAAVRDPATWGAKQTMTLDVHVRVDERLSASAGELLGRIVDGDVVREGQCAGTGVMSNLSALPSDNTSPSTAPSSTEDDDHAV